MKSHDISFVGPWFWREQLGWRTMWPISCSPTRLPALSSESSRNVSGEQSRSLPLPHKAPQGLLPFLPHSPAFLASIIRIYPDTAFLGRDQLPHNNTLVFCRRMLPRKGIMWTTWAFLIFLLPAPSGGRELSRFEEEKNVESEAEEVPLEISWRPGSRVKRENKVRPLLGSHHWP